MTATTNSYKNARNKAGITAQAAAVELDVAMSTLSSWENSKTSPDAFFVARMAELYHVTADELIASERDKVDR